MLKETALILAGHGSTKNAESSRFTRETAHRLRERGVFAEVRAGFWKEEPSFGDALRGLQSKRAVVVPWFLAKGYFTTQILPREFGETAEVECRVTEPIGSRPEILGHFQKRAERLLAVKNWKPNQVSLLVASHGTPLHTGSRGAAVGLAEQLAKDGYRTARAVFLEEEPKIADWRILIHEGPVVVLPHFLAGGLHGSKDVPELLGISGSGEGWYRSEKGELGYGEPLGRPEEVEEMIIELAVAKVWKKE
jgi:sirohydrochlorin cobaltochelatase